MNDQALKAFTKPSKTEYGDGAVKQLLYPALAFLIIGLLLGTFISISGFLYPELIQNQYATFGRLRPVHVGTVALLWLMTVDMALFYFIVPRLCGIRLWSLKLANYTNILWLFTLIVGVYSYPFGTNWGWEYAELPTFVGFIPVKALVVFSWILFSINMIMTVKNRRYEKMYVSLWYALGALFWTAITFIMGIFLINMVPGGISRVNINFFYVHNLVGLIFTPMGLAIAYYFIPKISKTPLYSHKLSMVGFWSIALVYAWVGAHHIIHGPMSQWLQTTSIVFSIWLFIPVWTVIINFFGTLKGHFELYSSKVSIRFLMMGTFFYLVTSLQGSLQALRNVNEITSKTDWIISHSHIALYGTFTFFAFGSIYYVVETISKREVWSSRLANWHFGLNFWGSMLMFITLMIGGYLQGFKWASWADGSGYAEYRVNLSRLPFLQTVAEMWFWWSLRSFSGFLIIAGNLLFVFNIYKTLSLSANKQAFISIKRESFNE
jgi:cytochrome c oxidase cbb3-type subunit 1